MVKHCRSWGTGREGLSAEIKLEDLFMFFPLLSPTSILYLIIVGTSTFPHLAQWYNAGFLSVWFPRGLRRGVRYSFHPSINHRLTAEIFTSLQSPWSCHLQWLVMIHFQSMLYLLLITSYSSAKNTLKKMGKQSVCFYILKLTHGCLQNWGALLGKKNLLLISEWISVLLSI